MDNSKVIQYLVYGDVGMSSKAIISQYINKDANTNFSFPYDCSDLKRCIDAVNCLDLDNINHMKVISRQWHNISKKWFELVITFNTNKKECFYILQECIK